MEETSFLLEEESDFSLILNYVTQNKVNEFFPSGRNVLMESIKFKKLDLVKILVENGADVNLCSKKKNYHPLMYACNKDCPEIVKYLLEKGADPNIKSNTGWTVLMFAIYYNANECVKILLEKDIDINAICDIGNNALINAVLKNNIEIVYLLLKKGVNVNHLNHEGISAFWIAASNSNIKIMSLLLNLHADVNVENTYGITPLTHSIREKNFIAFNFLTRVKGINLHKPNKNGIEPVDFAIMSGNKPIIEYYLQYYPSIGSKNIMNIPCIFMLIDINGDIQCLKLLLAKGADLHSLLILNNESYTPLMFAIKKDNFEMANVIIKKSNCYRYNKELSFLALQRANFGDFRYVDLLREHKFMIM